MSSNESDVEEEFVQVDMNGAVTQNHIGVQITRLALGNIGSIGDLYDCRTDNFCGLNIFDDEIPESARMVTKLDFADVQQIQGDDFLGKAAKFDLRTEQQVSLLTGLSEVRGPGHFLLGRKQSTQTAKASLFYQIKTAEEVVDIFHEDLNGSYHVDTIENAEATHVVVGVTWGANSVFTTEYEVGGADVKQAEEALCSQLKKLSLKDTKKKKDESENVSATSSTDNDELESDDDNLSNFSDVKITLYGDIFPENQKVPKTMKKALDLMKKIPSFVAKTNDGKGFPLIYTLIPIKFLHEHLSITPNVQLKYESIDEDTRKQVVRYFEAMSKVQQHLFDVNNYAVKFQNCAQPEELVKIATFKKQMIEQEELLRSKLQEAVAKIRSREMKPEKIEEIAENFFGSECELSLKKVWTEVGMLYGCLVEKTNLARGVEESGGKYIGVGANLDEEIMKNLESVAEVFFFTRNSKTKDLERWEKNCLLFQEEMKVNGGEFRFYAVDCDIHPNLMPKGKSSCIQVLKNGHTLSSDLLVHKEKEDKISWARCTGKKENVSLKPTKLRPLTIPCAGTNCDPKEEYNWTCKSCLSRIEYGFDGYCYCMCGRSLATQLEFKCTHPGHGKDFEKHHEDQIKELVGKLEPFKEMNILILGETGVGKSTWINAFANFIAYPTLEEAELHDLITLIPSKFTVYSENFKQITVDTGKDNNEVLKSGQSATQGSKVYKFEKDKTIIRLIDTPGVGDTRGIEQDKHNFKNILDTLGDLEELHGICILLKPNNARVNVMFRFCIKELLTHLHRDAARNIIFCFTNSRGTFYRPGDTMPALMALLDENKQVKITISQDTVYCYDSEAYRFLAAVKNDPPVSFPEDEKCNFAQSWEKSITETNRMLDYIRNLKPHPIKSTLNLNHTRDLVLKLTRPLAEISRNIQTNKGIVEDEKKFIESMDEKFVKLELEQWTHRTEIEVTKIDYPKTVCSNGNCVRLWNIDGSVTTTEYVQVCHDHCGLKGVHQDSIGDPGLIRCKAMNNGMCKHATCGHSYREHLHVYYESKQVLKKVEDQSVKEALEKNLNAKDTKTKIIEGKNQLIEEYEAELRKIQDSSIRFAYFLKRNAITPYNDGMEQYLDHLIKEEEYKVSQGGNAQTMKALKESKASYIMERNILEEAMKQGEETGNEMTPKDIENMVNELKALEHSGESLKEALKCVNRTSSIVYQSAIIPIFNPMSTRRRNKNNYGPAQSYGYYNGSSQSYGYSNEAEPGYSGRYADSSRRQGNDNNGRGRGRGRNNYNRDERNPYGPRFRRNDEEEEHGQGSRDRGIVSSFKNKVASWIWGTNFK